MDFFSEWLSKKDHCFIIAEAGVNHNGDIALAKKIIDAASNAQVDAIKFQTYKSENLILKSAEKADYQKNTTGSHESQYEMLKRLELSYHDFQELSVYAQNKGIIFLSTPFDCESVDFLDSIGVPAFKIASGELTNYLLLKKIGNKKRPVILSTGMATLSEINDAIFFLKNNGAEKIILMHCTTSYPASVDAVNLRAMETLHCAFKVPIGYSDHTEGIEIPIAAVAMGASLIEKHLTLDKKLPGPDHKSSIEPQEFKKMVDCIRRVEMAFGDGIKNPSQSEIQMRQFSRKSLVAKKNIQKGDKITEELLEAKRPGSGISPIHLEKIIGLKARKHIKTDEQIAWSSLLC